MRIVVEGCGEWAMHYLDALQRAVSQKHGIFFTFDSTFGLDRRYYKLPAQHLLAYMQATLKNVEKIRKSGFASVDVKDTLHQNSIEGRKSLPKYVDAVFIVTPDRTHCQVAKYWLNKTKYIFVEKPFGISSTEIEEFCTSQQKSDTEVYAVDHYFIRCSQAASDADYFLRHLLVDPNSKSDIKSFDFCMTEPPMYTDDGRPMLFNRVLSVQEGMVFDMGAHALPCLIPFLKLEDPNDVELKSVRAGISDGLRDILFEGAESYSIANVSGTTRLTNTKISGNLIVGKDIGQYPEKFLRIYGQNGHQLTFDLARFRVIKKENSLPEISIAPLYGDWCGLLIDQVLQDRLPAGVTEFGPKGAKKIISFLEKWRECIRGQDKLVSYVPGTDRESLAFSEEDVT